jgi:hypothetical protein
LLFFNLWALECIAVGFVNSKLAISAVQESALFLTLKFLTMSKVLGALIATAMLGGLPIQRPVRIKGVVPSHVRAKLRQKKGRKR